MDKYGIDGHKLMYHVSRVSDWLHGKNIYPIYMEVSPMGACNHRCAFCGLDFMGYRKRALDTKRLKEIISELAELGLKSIMYAGEGEPLLHGDIVDIILHTRESGIDVALTTNGVLLDQKKADRILGALEWIKVSCNAGTPSTYARIHGTKERDFGRLMDNLSMAVQTKKANRHSSVLGMQILLLPENEHEVIRLAEKAREIGLDYLVVKPYSQHPQSITSTYKDIRYSGYESLAEKLAALNTNSFNVIVRLRTMRQWDEKKKEYHKCHALPFWSYLDAGGNVWGCSVYMEDERFRYGNIYEQSFQKIWEGEKRRASLSRVAMEQNPESCRVNCRMDAVNRYLWELKHPPEHVNFI